LSLGRVESGGVAFWAHIGGFVVGFAVAALMRARERLRPEPPTFQLHRRRYAPWHPQKPRW
jgi:membrane associated rhomboid family serine protease